MKPSIRLFVKMSTFCYLHVKGTLQFAIIKKKTIQFKIKLIRGYFTYHRAMILTTNTHHLLTEDILDVLKKQEVYTVLDFLKSGSKALERHTSLSYVEIIEVKRNLAKHFSAAPNNALTLYQKILSTSALISTGIPDFDQMIQGGFVTGTIYEICGSAHSNKLELVLSILVQALCNGNAAYFIDTKKDFCAKRIRSKLSYIKSEEETLFLLNKIQIRNISDKYELISAIHQLKEELEQGLFVRLIIIHSLSVLFARTNCDPTENNNILNQLANILRLIATEHNVVIILTNLITNWTARVLSEHVQSTEHIACGKYWRGVPNVRIKLKKLNDNWSELSLIKYNNITRKPTCMVSNNIFNL